MVGHQLHWSSQEYEGELRVSVPATNCGGRDQPDRNPVQDDIDDVDYLIANFWPLWRLDPWRLTSSASTSPERL